MVPAGTGDEKKICTFRPHPSFMEMIVTAIRCFFIVVAVCYSPDVIAQRLPIKIYSPRTGAPVNGANSIFQDGNGWMWFTNGYEVMRYDGYRFKSFLPASRFKMEYASHVMNVNGETWVAANPYPLKVVGDSLEALDTPFRDLDIVHYSEYHNVPYFLCTDGLYTIKNKILQPLITDSILNIASPLATLVPFNDSLLLTYEYREALVVFNLKRKTVSRLPVPVLDIRQDKNRNLFLLLKNKGLVILKEITWQKKDDYLLCDLYYPLQFSNEKNESFIIDKQNNIWLFKQFERLIKISPDKKVYSFTEANGLPSLWFNQLFIDREENLWIAFFYGLCKMNPTQAERFTQNESLYSNHTTFFRKDSSSRVFVGTENGVNVFSDDQMQQLRMNGKPFYCSDLLPKGNELFYIRDSSLFAAKVDLGDFTIRFERKLASFPGLATQIAMDRQGTVFIATTFGLYAWHHNRLTEPLPQKLYIRRLIVDSRGRLWTGDFTRGLCQYKIHYEKDRLSLIKINDVVVKDPGSPLLEKVRALCEDQQGNILAGTRFNGLFYVTLQGDAIKTVRHFGKADGLKSDNIWGVSVDSSNAWWVANSRGLDCLQKHGSRWVITDEGKSQQIFYADHVLATENKVLVGSHPGLLILNRDARPSPFRFSVFITRIDIEGKPMKIDPVKQWEQSLNYTQNNLSIEFSANSYLDEEAVLYSYCLRSNGKKEWSTPSPLHAINYSSLRPGTYEFRVKAQNISGDWSSNEAVFVFEIRPPFWQRWWFIGVCLVLTGCLLVFLYRYRIRQLTHLQKMRNNISRNLHDDIGASLSNINILNELAKRNITDEEKAKSYLSKAGEDIQRISESLSDIVWNINPRYDDMDNLFIRMKRYAADMMDGKDIAAELLFPENNHKISMPMEQRRDFYLIFKEAVNNLVKYSKATAAKVEVRSSDHSIHLLITDNGKGFDAANMKQGNGIQNMKQRAEKWKAVLQVQSSSGNGTTILLNMKLGKN